VIAITPIETGTPLLVEAAPGRTSAVRRLAVAEALRLLRHPAFLAGCALTLVVLLANRDDANFAYLMTIGGGAMGPGLGAMIAANLATLRERADGAEELLDPVPLGVADRTRALALATLAPALVAAVLVTAAGAAVAAIWDMRVAFVDGHREAWPAPVELLQVPAFVLVFALLGIALGRWWPYRLAGLVVGIAWFFLLIPTFFWTPGGAVGHLSPLLDHSEVHHWVQWSPGYGYNVVTGFDRVAMAWHVAYLGGIALALAGAALARHTRAPLVGRLLTVGFLVAVGAGFAQIG
jgi:hypothetical protein